MSSTLDECDDVTRFSHVITRSQLACTAVENSEMYITDSCYIVGMGTSNITMMMIWESNNILETEEDKELFLDSFKDTCVYNCWKVDFTTLNVQTSIWIPHA